MDRSLLGRNDHGTIYAVERHIAKSGSKQEKWFMKAFTAFINSEYDEALQIANRILPSIKDTRLKQDTSRIKREVETILAKKNQYSAYLSEMQAKQAREMAPQIAYVFAMSASYELARNRVGLAMEHIEEACKLITKKVF